MQDDFLYRLLPEIYRQLDETRGLPLRALLAVIDSERARLEAGVDALYDNAFVETCEGAAIAGIAALVGETDGARFRAAVANAIAGRRRKGTVAGLERRVADLTGWPAMARVSSDVSLHVWRQTAYPVEGGTPRRAGPGRYTFQPMGLDIPLFRAPVASYDIERPLERRNVPAQLGADSVEGIAVSAGAVDLTIRAADLSNWSVRPPSGSAIVDPLLGRLMVPEGTDGSKLEVSYAYGFSGDLGGGPYPREEVSTKGVEWVAYVLEKAAEADAAANYYRTLSEALEAFRRTPGNGVIRILDSATYAVGADDVAGAAPAGCNSLPQGRRCLTIEAASGEAPCIQGTLLVRGADPGMSVTLSGLWFEGPLHVEGNLVLTLQHCTLAPPEGQQAERHRGIHARPGEQRTLRVNLEFSICGPVRLPATVAGFFAADSIVDGGSHPAIAGGDGLGPPTQLERVTVIGDVCSESLESSDVLRVVDGSLLVARRYGDPGYCQLRRDSPQAIRAGAANGSELGAFNFLDTPQRERRLERAVEGFVPDGLPTRVVFET